MTQGCSQLRAWLLALELRVWPSIVKNRKQLMKRCVVHQRPPFSTHLCYQPQSSYVLSRFAPSPTHTSRQSKEAVKQKNATTSVKNMDSKFAARSSQFDTAFKVSTASGTGTHTQAHPLPLSVSLALPVLHLRSCDSRRLPQSQGTKGKGRSNVSCHGRVGGAPSPTAPFATNGVHAHRRSCGFLLLCMVVLCGSAKKGKAKSKKEKKKRKKKRTRGAISFDVEDLAGTAGKETTSNMPTPLLRLVDSAA